MNNEMPYFENDRFFKDGEQVYIHLSTEFPKFVGVMRKHQFIEIVYILSGEAIHTVGKEYYVERDVRREGYGLFVMKIKYFCFFKIIELYEEICYTIIDYYKSLIDFLEET
ncbi:MAG: hypothetical protein J6Q27_02905 [Clostridia bacterium]|nr:hypothetical protein [Clostridia bacterium]